MVILREWSTRTARNAVDLERLLNLLEEECWSVYSIFQNEPGNAGWLVVCNRTKC